METDVLVQFETRLDFQVVLIVESEIVKLVFAFSHDGFGFE